MSRVRWRLTALSLLATVLALQPITSLFTPDSWFPEAVGVVVLVAVTGALLRATVRSRVAIVLVQLVVAAYAVLLRFGAETFTFFLPTSQTLELANSYGVQALTTIQKHSAPAPLDTGVAFCLVAAAALVAVAVDGTAVTWQSPAAAGLPLLTAYLITAANASDALPFTSFLAPVLVWLLMVHVTTRSRIGRWGTTSEAAEGEAEEGRDRSALWSLSSGAFRFGAVAVLAAIVVPAVIPHFPPRYFADGLARSGDAGGAGTVGFNDTLDLTRSLRSTSQAPVLRYSTTGPGRVPLRAVATSLYADGEWTSDGRSRSLDQPLPLPSPESRTDYVMSVSENTLKAPSLATPYPVVAADLADGIDWTMDPVTRDLRVNRVARDYQVTYSDIAPEADELRRAGDPDVEGRPDILPDDLAIPDEARSLVTQWADDVTAGKETYLDKAIAIQDHLRDTTAYSYDLDLGPRLRDEAGREIEPIRTFYETKRGYCVQFASAMIFLARAEGIPARMAIGFLPGTRSGSSFLVRASDAHAWPELYFEGHGWVRFEPTPGGRGSPPAYAIDTDAATPGVGAPTDDEDSTSTPTTATRRQDTAGEDLGAGTGDSPWFGAYLTTGDLITLTAVLVALLAVSVMPLTAWLVRLRRRRSAANRQELIEAEWEDLTSHLTDLGLAPPPGGTLRQWSEHFIRTGHLDDANAQVMDRVTATLERSRYDRPGRTTPEQTLALHRDIRTIRRRVSRSRAWKTRLRSVLWPSTAVDAWRRLAARFSRRGGDDGPADTGER